MEVTHKECGRAVMSGPWGNGNTTAIDAVAGRHECEGAVVKVEPGATKRGATAGGVMQRVVEELRRLHDRPLGTQLSNATWTLRSMIFSLLSEFILYTCYDAEAVLNPPRFTFIFPEAQYLSTIALALIRS